MENKSIKVSDLWDQQQDSSFCLNRNQRKSIEQLYVDETIFAQFNGLLGSRGHFVEGYGGDYDQPQTFINGFYNTYPYHYEENSPQFPQNGQTMINLPDASLMKLSVDAEEINIHSATLQSLLRTFDLKNGVVCRNATYRTPSGYEFTVSEQKIVSVSNKNLIITRMTVKSLNYQGVIRVQSILKMPFQKKQLSTDPRVSRPGRHLILRDLQVLNQVGLLKAETEFTKMEIQVGITHDRLFDYTVDDNQLTGTCEIGVEPQQEFSITKYQFYHASHIDEACDVVMQLRRVEPFDWFARNQAHFAQDFWYDHELYLSDSTLNIALRYNVYQLSLSGGVSEHLQIAAKGISGEGYEGHYFWDTEIYMLPYFILNEPDKARNILKYRNHTLPKAKIEANKMGVSRGAKIPWRTINGEETSPYYPAGSAQIHINSDLVYALMQYYHASNDLQFMIDYGFELMLETALFILDYGFFDKKGFHLSKVTGPDEYSAIVNDNFYTNRMAEYHFDAVVGFWKQNKSLCRSVLKKVGASVQDLEDLSKAARQMTYLTDEDLGIILQDDSFLNLKDLDLTLIPQENRPMLLHYHPLYIYRHQVLKQADTILALVLMNDCNKDIYQKTFDYYLKRTTHDSSLSKCIYGIAAYDLKKSNLAYEYFQNAAMIDLGNDIGHTRHGLHVANMGGTYLTLIYGIFGIRINKILTLSHPISHIQVKVKFGGVTLRISILNEVLTIESDGFIVVELYGELLELNGSHSVLIKNS
ncbi:MAG: hypothetical protein CVU85_08160 [Firmicutes bacterium HGW-Firmicutes-10]|nr:MAG: hypothetical protein CVU85_08160 [Firmicutes bacterium HGW-Firmicutes-10]